MESFCIINMDSFISVVTELLQQDPSKTSEVLKRLFENVKEEAKAEVVKKVSEVFPAEKIMQIAMNLHAKPLQVQAKSH